MIIALEELLNDIENSKHSTLDVKCAVIGLSFDSPNVDTADYICLILRKFGKMNQYLTKSLH